MSVEEAIRDIFTYTLNLTSIDHKVLETLISMKRGSAYSVRKTSGLKNYPTVLRSLKKLQKKRLVESVGEKIKGRSKRLYVATILGEITNYVLKGESPQVIRTIAAHSPLFQEMLNSRIKDIQDSAYFIARDILRSADMERIPKVDNLVRNHVLDHVRNDLGNIHEKASKDRMEQLIKVQWIRELTLEEIESVEDWFKEQIKELTKLKRMLKTRYFQSDD